MTSTSVNLTLPPQLKKEITQFLKTVAQTSRSKSKKPYEYLDDRRMSREGHQVYMDDTQHLKYLKFVARIHALYPHSKKYNERYIEEKFRDTIFIATSPEGTPDENAKKATARVQELFEYKVEKYTVCVPATGINLWKRTAWKFGKVTFFKNTNRAFRKNAKILFGDKSFVHVHSEKYYASIEVNAIDTSSAIKIAREEIELHCHVLNALGLMFGTFKSFDDLSNYGDKGSVINTFIVAWSDGGSSALSRGRSVALGGFSPHMLRYPYFSQRLKWRYISKQLQNPTSSLFTERLLPALKWLGKSIFRTNNEDVYLDYSLAMEAIYFQTNHQDGELMNELKRRIYLLQFTNTSYLTAVISSFNNFDELYKRRSRIVHRGGVAVSDNDLESMYYLVKGSLQKILTYSRFRNKTSESFEHWLMQGRKK